VTDPVLPAWSEPFITGRRDALDRARPIGAVDRDLAFGGSDGSGVTVAIIDSGVDGSHPAVGGRVVASVVVVPGEDRPSVSDDPDALDVVGHGTACAGIIHALAPAADLISVRVLGPDNRGKGAVFAAGLEWAIEHGASVVNLSLSSRSEALLAVFHELADRAYFANVLLVCAANNVPGPSYPSLFASVVSVAAHDVPDAWTWFYNPRPPVEFGARGVDVEVAWRDHGWIIATGNSFAAPHVAGLAALIRAKHPAASPFEVKAMLAATADR
jgi:subtilisin family serine protease